MKFTVCLNRRHLCSVDAKDWRSALIEVIKDHPKLMVFAGIKPAVCCRNDYGTIRLLDVLIHRNDERLYIGECQ